MRLDSIGAVTGQMKELSGLGTQAQNTFGRGLFGGFDEQRNAGQNRVAASKERYEENNFDNRSRRDDNETTRDDNYTTTDKYRNRALSARWRGEETRANLDEMGAMNGGNENGGGGYSRRISQGQFYPGGRQPVYMPDAVRGGLTQGDLGNAQRYAQTYNAPVAAPQSNVNGVLDRNEVVAGLRNAKIHGNGELLSDFVDDLQKVTGRCVTYTAANGQTYVNFDLLASELNQYAKGKVDFDALERGDAGAWQSLKTTLNNDAAQRAGGVGSPAPTGAAPAQPQQTITNPRDEKVENRIAELLQNESLENRKKISAQATAALQQLGIKVEGSPIEELAGWIAKEKPELAEKMRSGSLADAAAAFRQASGELESAATRNSRIAKINAPVVPATQPVAPVPLTLTEDELKVAMARAKDDTLERVSRMKGGLNRMLDLEGGDRFNARSDDLGTPKFIEKLTDLANKNLDQATIAKIKAGEPFTFSGTFQTLEKNFEKNPNGFATPQAATNGKSTDAPVSKPASITVPTTTAPAGQPVVPAQPVNPTAPVTTQAVATATTLGDGGRTHYERTLGTIVDSSRWAEEMQTTSAEAGKTRLVRDISTGNRNNNTEFGVFHKDFAAKNADAITTETARQNDRNAQAWKEIEANDVAIEALKAKPVVAQPVTSAPKAAEPATLAPKSETPPTVAKPEAAPAPKAETAPAAKAEAPALAANAPNPMFIEKAKELVGKMTDEQKKIMTREMEKEGISVKPGEEAKAALELIEKKFPGSLEKISKGDLIEGARVFGELEKMMKPSPAAQPVSTSVVASNPMAKLLQEANFKNTVSGGAQEASLVSIPPAQGNIIGLNTQVKAPSSLGM